MQLQTYEKYKPSGIDWLGEIPEGWEVTSFKRIVSILTDYTANGSFADLATNVEYLEKPSFAQLIRLTDIRKDLKECSIYVNEHSYNFLKKSSLFGGEILMANVGAYSGYSFLLPDKLDFKATLGPNMFLIEFEKKRIYKKYIFYTLSSNIVLSRLISLSASSAQPKLNKDDVRSVFCIVPPLQTQTAIADYLDKHTALIDKKIELLKAKKQSYTELKQTLINEVVTKGLDTTVEMKDSGIEWIGQTPKHWEVKRGKELFKENPKSKITANEGGKIGKYKFFTSSNEQSKWLDYFAMDSESILFSTGGSAGINYCEREYSYSTDTWSIYGNRKIHLKYFAYYFESILYEINNLGFRGAGLEHLQKDFINLGEIIFPPKSEQIVIANYLDKKTSKIDQIIKKIDQSILALQEFRKTLINDTVTGKVKVL